MEAKEEEATRASYLRMPARSKALARYGPRCTSRTKTLLPSGPARGGAGRRAEGMGKGWTLMRCATGWCGRCELAVVDAGCASHVRQIR